MELEYVVTGRFPGVYDNKAEAEAHLKMIELALACDEVPQALKDELQKYPVKLITQYR